MVPKKNACRHRTYGVLEYFNSHYIVNPENGCWGWTGFFNTFGYALFKCNALRNGMTFAASRASWIIHYGEISSRKIFVLHKCDNRKCVNPDHLFLGSHKDNMKDMKDKGRAASGERHGMAATTAKDVLKMRELYRSGQSSNNIAKIFKVSGRQVLRIVLGDTWKSVGGPIARARHIDDLVKPRKNKVYESYRTS